MLYCNCADYSLSLLLLFYGKDCCLFGGLSYSEVEKMWCAHWGLAKNFKIFHISEVSYSDTLTSATYRFLHLTFCTYVSASVLYKIAIGTTEVRLEKMSAIFEFSEKHVLAISSYTIVQILTKTSMDHH